jgi:hypothetical protein
LMLELLNNGPETISDNQQDIRFGLYRQLMSPMENWLGTQMYFYLKPVLQGEFF